MTTAVADVAAQAVCQAAFQRLEELVKKTSPADRASFQSSTLKDVNIAIRYVERELGKRGELKNLRRVLPFLQGLDNYAKVVEVLCNGTPYLPWIWAPIKFIIQVASEHSAALEKMLEMYAKMGDTIPIFDNLGEAFLQHADFQKLLSSVYEDILDFHGETYKFFHTRGWKIFFKTLAGRLDRKLTQIIKSFEYHCDLISRQSQAIDILEASRSRQAILDQIDREERERDIKHMQSILKWLEVQDADQESELDHLNRQIHGNTCNWILSHAQARSWLRLTGDRIDRILWLSGKPGAGKSVLSSSLVRFLMQDGHCTVLYYYCSVYSSRRKDVVDVMRTLVAQLLRANADLSGYVYEEYIVKARACSLPNLRRILEELLNPIKSIKIVIDGVDEIDEQQQPHVLDELLKLSKASSRTNHCGLLISSRDTPILSTQLRNYSRINLSTEQAAVNASITSYVEREIESSRDEFVYMGVQDLLPGLEKEIIQKAEGMFLWVKLIIQAMKRSHNSRQFRSITQELPSDLDEMYRRILGQIINTASETEKRTIISVFSWTAHSARTLRKCELLSVLTLRFSHPDNDTQFSRQEQAYDRSLELCKPMIEEKVDGTVAMIHFTALQYLRQGPGSSAVSAMQANQEISVGCLTCLGQSLNLIAPDASDTKSASKILIGYYDIFGYAIDFWLQHWLRAMNETEELSERDILVQFLDYLHDSDDYILQCRNNAIGTSHARDALPPEASDRQLAERLDRKPHLAAFVAKLVYYLKVMEQQEFSEVAEVDAMRVRTDPTFVSEAFIKYKDLILQIANEKHASSIDEQVRERYNKRLYGRYFICGWFRCGERFENAKLLEDHEFCHVGGIKCLHAGCTFSRIGFKTSAAFKQHVRKYHPSEKQGKGPIQIRRPHVCSGTHEGLEFGCEKRFASQRELNSHQIARSNTICDRFRRSLWHSSGDNQEQPDKVVLSAFEAEELLDFGPLDGGDVEIFDFDSFLHTEDNTDFNFDFPDDASMQ